MRIGIPFPGPDQSNRTSRTGRRRTLAQHLPHPVAQHARLDAAGRPGRAARHARQRRVQHHMPPRDDAQRGQQRGEGLRRRMARGEIVRLRLRVSTRQARGA